jgi:serine/threonine-protein kinase RsbW
MSQVSPATREPASPILWWTRKFPGSKDQVSQARGWLEDLLPDCEQLEVLTLLVSELVTNALLHTGSGKPDGRFGLTVEWSPATVRVLVMDQGSPTAPEVMTRVGGAAWDSENGRGLFLVDQLADDWGAASLPGGRLVWLEMAWAAKGGPLLEAPGGYQAALRDVGVLRGEFPATTIWWGHRSEFWWAALPGTSGEAGLVRAPTIQALSAVLVTVAHCAAGTGREADSTFSWPHRASTLIVPVTSDQQEAGSRCASGSYPAARSGDRGEG